MLRAGQAIRYAYNWTFFNGSCIAQDVAGRKRSGNRLLLASGISAVPGIEDFLFLIVADRAPCPPLGLPRFDLAYHRILRMFFDRVVGPPDFGRGWLMTAWATWWADVVACLATFLLA